MQDEPKTREQLITELHQLRERVAELEKDHSECRRAEDLLRHKSEELQLILDTVPATIWFKDTDNNILRVNRATCEMMGLQASEIEGKNACEIFPDRLAEQYYRDDLEVVNSRRPKMGIEEEFTNASGELRWVRTDKVPWFDDQGYLAGVLAFAVDVTNRRQAEAALRESEEKYRALVETTGTGYAILDPEGTVLDANREYVKLTGHGDLEEIRGRKVSEWTAPYDLARNAEKIQKCIEQGNVHDFEIDYMDSAGKCTSIEVNATVLTTSEGMKILALCRDITERKLAVDALRESEERFSRFFRASPIGTSITRLSDGRFADVNDAFLGLLGYTREEVLGQNPLKLEMWADLKDRAKMVELLEKHGGMRDFETRFRGKSGEIRYVRVSAEVIEVAGQEYILGLTHDITDLKQAEKALRVSEESARNRASYLQATLDAAPAIIFTAHDRECRGISGNRSARELVRVDEGTNMSQRGEHSEHVTHYHLFKDGRELAFDERPLQSVAKSGQELRDYSMEFVLDDGAQYSLLGNIVPVFDTEGKPSGAIAAYVDITGLKKAENACRESENRLNLAIQQAGMGTWDIDLGTGQANWSQNHFNLLGYEPRPDGKATLEMWRSRIHPDDLDNVMQEFERARREHDLYAPEYRIIRADTGDIVWPTVYGRFLYDDNGEATRFTGIFFDSTERKLLEEERRKMLIQMHQSQKVEAIGTLAGGIAHDFNNILLPIMGYTEMALDEIPESSPLRESLEEVLKASRRARDLVRQILAVSRFTQEQQKIPIDISPIVKEALKLLRSTLPTSIEIKKNIRMGAALADPSQIHQVLMNLCTNAAHAMNGEGVLDVSLREIDLAETDLDVLSISELEPGPYLRLRVSDTGAGIDAETMKRIFDPYFTTKEVGRGSGLGLAVVHGIVKYHEGAITVQSQPGKGTTFSVYLPRIDLQSEEAKQIDDLLPRGSETILLVDDEIPVLEMGTKLLERLGYKVITRTNGLNALEVFRSNPDNFDLVITDYTMPKMTGLDLARKLRRIRPDMPILLCTGFSEKVTPDRSKELGMEILVKPYGVRQIAEVVRKILDVRKEA